jgi:hypothetical protein
VSYTHHAPDSHRSRLPAPLRFRSELRRHLNWSEEQAQAEGLAGKLARLSRQHLDELKRFRAGIL